MDLSLILNLLTDDLLTRVLDCLHDDTDRKSFRATCKSFHRVESTHRTRVKFLRPEFIPRLLRHYTRAHALDFSSCPRIYDGAISALLNDVVCGNWTIRVKKLVLCRTTSLKWLGLEMLVKGCMNLESVDVSHCCEFGDRECDAISFGAGLKEIKLDKCLGVTDVGLAKIAIRCGKLEKISLKWCSEVSNLGIDFLSQKCSGLKYLSVSYLKISNESLRSISSLKKLETLLMVGCGLVGDEGLGFIGNGCSSLKVLTLLYFVLFLTLNIFDHIIMVCFLIRHSGGICRTDYTLVETNQQLRSHYMPDYGDEDRKHRKNYSQLLYSKVAGKIFMLS
ncbi:F-box/LRR-repeat protein 3 [Tanacetum coccineum]